MQHATTLTYIYSCKQQASHRKRKTMKNFKNKMKNENKKKKKKKKRNFNEFVTSNSTFSACFLMFGVVRLLCLINNFNFIFLKIAIIYLKLTRDGERENRM